MFLAILILEVTSFDAGVTIGDYEIVKPLGRGSNAFVFEVKERKSNKTYALRVLQDVDVENEIEVEIIRWAAGVCAITKMLCPLSTILRMGKRHAMRLSCH